MRIGWGWKVTIILTLFVGYIVFFLIQALNFHGDLVTEDYYDQELQYQDNIDAQTNFKQLKDSVSILALDEYIQVELPQCDSYEGELILYRPSNAKLDKRYPIKGEKVYIPKSDLKDGKYQLKISWKSKNKVYYTEQSLAY